ncbi:MAG: hypothetical protein V4638_07005 [Bacteroidota bacterium]
MKIIYFSLLLTLLLSACSTPEGGAKVELQNKITSMEDSLRKNPSALSAPKLALANMYLSYQEKFPEDEQAPAYLDKAHMVYSGIGLYVKSAKLADLIIEKYPKYINRAMVLESQATNYDYLIEPRDSAKVRYYYNLLLSENPNFDKDARKQIVYRLKNNHLTLNEFIKIQDVQE